LPPVAFPPLLPCLLFMISWMLCTVQN
jgi:hypothetical protein